MTGQQGHKALASKKPEKKPKPKDSTSRKKTVLLPCFDNGICKQCKSTNMVDESIHCNLCNELFHVACSHKNGVKLKESICTTEFRDIVRPMISNNIRWGHFMFMCENCHDFIQSAHSLKDSPKPAISEVENVVPSDQLSNVHGDPPLLHKVETLIKENNKSLLESFREEMHSIILDKLSLCPADNEKTSDYSSNDCNTTSRPSSALSSYNYSSFAAAVSGDASSPEPKRASTFSLASSDHGKDKELLVLDSPPPNADLSTAPQVLSELLYDTRILAMKTNLLQSQRKITLVFPSLADREKGKNLIETCDQMKGFGFLLTLPKKALPKITVSNIPLQLLDGINSSLPIEEFRSQAKNALLDVIPLKNPGLKHLIDDGHVFEIVYVNKGHNYITAGIKVSPQIRNLLTTDGKVFILNSACPVKDRFIIRQCFNCQKLHHMSKQCPDQNIVVCMYCSGRHRTSDCNFKYETKRYRCRNCSLSKDPKISSSCHTHHSSSEDCPIIQQALARYKENTLTAKN